MQLINQLARQVRPLSTHEKSFYNENNKYSNKIDELNKEETRLEVSIINTILVWKQCSNIG